MSEEAVCDITLKMLKATLKKYPRKKFTFKDYCKENMVADIEELSENMALEVLDIIDNPAYIRATRLKELERRRIMHEELLETFKEFILAREEDYIIIEEVPNCYLVCKKINVLVQTENLNPTFQPFVRINATTYFINVIIKLSEDFTPTPLMTKLITRDCKIIKLTHIDTVGTTLLGIA